MCAESEFMIGQIGLRGKTSWGRWSVSFLGPIPCRDIVTIWRVAIKPNEPKSSRHLFETLLEQKILRVRIWIHFFTQINSLAPGGLCCSRQNDIVARIA